MASCQAACLLLKSSPATKQLPVTTQADAKHTAAAALSGHVHARTHAHSCSVTRAAVGHSWLAIRGTEVEACTCADAHTGVVSFTLVGIV